MPPPLLSKTTVRSTLCVIKLSVTSLCVQASKTVVHKLAMLQAPGQQNLGVAYEH
jgi:hypothetical protein